MFYIFCFYAAFICSFVVFKLFRLDLVFILFAVLRRFFKKLKYNWYFKNDLFEKINIYIYIYYIYTYVCVCLCVCVWCLCVCVCLYKF